MELLFEVLQYLHYKEVALIWSICATKGEDLFWYFMVSVLQNRELLFHFLVYILYKDGAFIWNFTVAMLNKNRELLFDSLRYLSFIWVELKLFITYSNLPNIWEKYQNMQYVILQYIRVHVSHQVYFYAYYNIII